MNNPKSFWLGWGSLIVAGGGAYFFAKRQIDADRKEKYIALQAKKAYNDQLQAQEWASSGFKDNDNAGHPSSEVANDPAPTRHLPETKEQQIKEKSKYEASTPYRSKPGDRFS
ncbi:hypothetical protein BJ508DRAFT_411511 [Ascobolus immersus RN42]|uniref:Uncharacterized protein n=1 Tax=Ascobolus immersus RN42 TaxID=1160509 RepID=A0A3N4IQ37_ASCIM|nr:hypothetical protein BJ508DRAFT_411511 [Ascobolus immersus RN42]